MEKFYKMEKNHPASLISQYKVMTIMHLVGIFVNFFSVLLSI
jgi:hypothetical protein